MKTAIGLFVFALYGSLATTAQIVPNGGCGCTVSSSAVGCGCAGAGGKKTGSAGKQSLPSDRPQLIDTLVTLLPGALLTRWVLGDDELFIGMGKGELVNEAKSPPAEIPVSEGSIFLMPKDEPYKLRNVGKDDVKVRVIRIHRAGPACQ